LKTRLVGITSEHLAHFLSFLDEQGRDSACSVLIGEVVHDPDFLKGFPVCPPNSQATFLKYLAQREGGLALAQELLDKTWCGIPPEEFRSRLERFDKRKVWAFREAISESRLFLTPEENWQILRCMTLSPGSKKVAPDPEYPQADLLEMSPRAVANLLEDVFRQCHQRRFKAQCIVASLSTDEALVGQWIDKMSSEDAERICDVVAKVRGRIPEALWEQLKQRSGGGGE